MFAPPGCRPGRLQSLSGPRGGYRSPRGPPLRDCRHCACAAATPQADGLRSTRRSTEHRIFQTGLGLPIELHALAAALWLLASLWICSTGSGRLSSGDALGESAVGPIALVEAPPRVGSGVKNSARDQKRRPIQARAEAGRSPARSVGGTRRRIAEFMRRIAAPRSRSLIFRGRQENRGRGSESLQPSGG